VSRFLRQKIAIASFLASLCRAVRTVAAEARSTRPRRDRRRVEVDAEHHGDCLAIHPQARELARNVCRGLARADEMVDLTAIPEEDSLNQQRAFVVVHAARHLRATADELTQPLLQLAF
jgi:hypothetical protein